MNKLAAVAGNVACRNFALENQRKEPLENAVHVRDAVARKAQGVTDADRDRSAGRGRLAGGPEMSAGTLPDAGRLHGGVAFFLR